MTGWTMLTVCMILVLVKAGGEIWRRQYNELLLEVNHSFRFSRCVIDWDDSFSPGQVRVTQLYWWSRYLKKVLRYWFVHFDRKYFIVLHQAALYRLLVFFELKLTLRLGRRNMTTVNLGTSQNRQIWKKLADWSSLMTSFFLIRICAK